ncbi:MAG: hypothetical protein QM777_19680 [Pseudorhodoferax sp.]
MKRHLLTIFVLLVAGCAKDLPEKTSQMDNQQRNLNDMCKQKPKFMQRKFTGSSLTIKMKCEKSINNSSEEIQKVFLQKGWIEKRKTERVILYCLLDSGISLVVDLDDSKQEIETIMRYPSANCGSAFSIRQMK